MSCVRMVGSCADLSRKWSQRRPKRMQGTKRPSRGSDLPPTLKISVAHTLGQGAVSTCRDMAYNTPVLQAGSSEKNLHSAPRGSALRKASFEPVGPALQMTDVGMWE
jgi:hypothetical protein